MAPDLETPRLWLRPLELADAQATQVLFPDWEIVRYLSKSVPWPYPADGALVFYQEVVLPAIRRGEEWHWTLRLKADPQHSIGCICLKKEATKNRGFWLGLPWQGQGLMTEASEVVTDFWFETLRFPVLRSSKAFCNEGSRRISLKNGMRLIAVEERDFVSGRLPSELWEITAEEWRARKRP